MSILRANTLQTLAGAGSPMTDVVNGSARAFVNFNGQGTVAIRQAYNVSSITDNGVGDYTLNFATPMVDANYIPVVGQEVEGVVNGSFQSLISLIPANFLQSSLRLQSRGDSPAGSTRDPSVVCVSIFR